jgi:phospholipid/cholesterol/gamma-HCH transport system permease protein
MLIKLPFIQNIGYSLGFFFRTLKGSAAFVVRGQVSFKVLIMQILFTFVEALGICSLLALALGAALNAIGMPLLASFSQEQLIYGILIMFITREVGPLITAIVLIARSATAIATEVAGMVISHEVEAYISVGIDPIEHLAVPRFLGVTISMFLINIYFSIFGLGASFVVAQVITPLPAEIYFNNLLQTLTLSDIVISIVKSIAFGMIMSMMALLQGFSVERASTEIPVAGLRAVQKSLGLIVVVDVILSLLYYTALA